MQGVRSGFVIVTVVVALAVAAPVVAAVALVDLDEGELLESSAADIPVVSADRPLDLLLLDVVQERIARGALREDGTVPVLSVSSDPGPALGARELTVRELLQVLLLTDSRAAARSLTAAIGPGEQRGRARMRAAACRLGLRRTTIPEDWPGTPTRTLAHASVAPAERLAAGTHAVGRRATTQATIGRAPPTTTVRDVARLAIAVFTDPAMRRRVALDGVPIANGAIIVRATAPLVTTILPGTPAITEARTDERGAALVAGTADGLDLLAIASGPGARQEARALLAHGLASYQRIEIVRAGQPVGREVKVRDGTVPWFSAVAAQSFAVTAPRTRPGALRLMLQLPAVVEAPLDRAQAIGELVIAEDTRVIGAVPLVVPLAVAPSRWIDTARE